jgi:Acyclic terpene utilisation family protein AtuA
MTVLECDVQGWTPRIGNKLATRLPGKLRILSYVADGRVGARPTLSATIRAGLERDIDVIASQGNGMDAGPFFLGAGETGAPALPHYYQEAMLGAMEAKIPFIFSLGGRAGADKQLESYLTVFDEIARNTGKRIRVAVISGEIKKDYLLKKLGAGVKMPRLYATPRLSPILSKEEIEGAEVIQGQMGMEPIMEALKLFDEGVIDGVLTGRALDTGIYMSYPMLRGFPKAGAAHLAKVIECGTMCCLPTDPFSAVIGELSADGTSKVWPIDESYRCTIKSVSGHSIYERDDPLLERNPGGVLDLTNASYEQIDAHTVQFAGAQWHPQPYTVKLEGVHSVGYETAVISVTSDPVLISCIDQHIEASVKQATEHIVKLGIAETGTFKVAVTVIGKGALPIAPPSRNAEPTEITVLLRVIAPTQEKARHIALTVRIRLQQGNYPGRTTTAGNFANPMPQIFMDQGRVYEFGVWHLLPLQDPCEPFGLKTIEFPRT